MGLADIYKAHGFKSRKAFERATGLSYMTIFRIDHGSTPDIATAKKMAAALGLTVDELLRALGGDAVVESDAALVSGPRFRLPVRARVVAGLADEVVEDLVEPLGWEWATDEPRDDCDVLEIYGDSMMPDFAPGDRLVVQRGRVPTSGSIVVAEFNPTGGDPAERKITVKVYIAKNGMRVLMPLNRERYQHTVMDARWTIRGVVIKHIRRGLEGRYAHLVDTLFEDHDA